ncbi:restriction endonuclease, partial [Klebsiella pneumoniae]|nr:restriction endonuclease [Klebsiella pneumoniae]
FVWELYENLSNPFSLKKQIIKYGAPGTGKTFQARQQTSLLFDIWKEEFAANSDFTHHGQIELVQFHPSFSYEDFIEGLRPILDEN